MGAIYANGEKVSGADITLVNGVFIDTDNVIVPFTTDVSYPITYTATEDCFVIAHLVANRNQTATARVDGNEIGTIYNGADATQIPINVFLKKGQVLTVTGTWTLTTAFAVYGIQAGSSGGGSGQIDYSTTEQKTGQKWIDGKDIWQKTLTAVSASTGETTLTHGISDFGEMIQAFGKVEYNSKDVPLPYVSTNAQYNIGVGNCDANGIDIGIGGGFSGGVTNVRLTLLYTKSTT